MDRKEPARSEWATHRLTERLGHGVKSRLRRLVRGKGAAGLELLPSLGLFGGIDAQHLKVGVERRPLTGVLLSLPDDHPGTLDLRGVQFRREGKRVMPASSVQAWQSSYATAVLPADGAFTLRSIRTTEESGAWWRVDLDPPLDVDEVRIYNRLDPRGVGSRRLRVSLRDSHGGWRLAEDVAGTAHVDATLALLRRLTGAPMPREALAGSATATRVRVELLAALAARARTEPVTLDPEEQRLLLALLPTTSTAEAPPSDDEWALLAHLLVAERKRVPRTASSFRLFSDLLTSRSALERLQREINLAASVFGLGAMSLTRHGLRDFGELRREAGVHLALMRRVQDDFAAMGLPLMLAYGTLLGAVREGDFLEHDDDVDLMYPVQAATVKEARAHADRLCADLTALGYHIWRNTHSRALNFHVTDPATHRHVDVFPVLLDRGTATLHMQRMKLRTIPADLVVPTRPFVFRQTQFSAPADPVGFLAERYGSSWSVPDPYDDWIRPLSD